MCRATSRRATCRRRPWPTPGSTTSTPRHASVSPERGPPGPLMVFRTARVSRAHDHDARETRAVRMSMRRMDLEVRAPSLAEFALQLGPAVEDGHDLVLARGRQREHDAVDADLAVEPQPLDVVGHAEQGDGQTRRIAAGLARHLAEGIDDAQ